MTFVSAGSSVFTKDVTADGFLTTALHGMEVSLFDINPVKLEDSFKMRSNMNEKYKAEAKKIKALKGAEYVVNAIRV